MTEKNLGADKNANDAEAGKNRAVPSYRKGAAQGRDGQPIERSANALSTVASPSHAPSSFVAAGVHPEIGTKPKTSGPRHTMELLFRHRKIALIAFLTVMTIAIFNSWSTRRTYQATATLLVNTAPLDGEGRGNNSSSIGADVEGVNQARKLETQMEILRTSAIMKGALQRLGEADRNALTEYYSVDITPVRKTDLLSVSTKSYSPESSAALSNAICNSYIEQSQEGNRREVSSAARYVRGQLETVSVNLEKARQRLKIFQQNNGISDMAEQARGVTGELSQIKSDLRQTRTERASLAAQITGLKAMLGTIPPQITSFNTTPRQSFNTLGAQLTKLQVDRITALAQFKPNSRTVRDIDAQIEGIQQRIRAEKPTEVSGLQKTANPAYSAVQQEAAQTQSRVRALDARAKVLEAALVRSNQELSLLPGKTSVFGQLTSEVVSLEQNYRLLNQKYQALRINEEARLANARTVSWAQPPSAPIGSSRARSLLMAAIFATIFAYALTLLVDRLDERIHNSQDAEDAAQLPVMIDVPFIKNKEHQSILTGNTTLLRESFEMLSTQIKLSSRYVPLRSLTITSSLPGEGKSLSSVNLAIAAALSGQRVVLVDCDLRQPSLHTFFNLDNKQGFTDVVNEHVRLDDALQDTGIRGLQLLSSGSETSKPLEILSSTAAQTCLDELTYIADLIIIDTPPALLIADAALLSTMTDATLLVVSCNEVARAEVRRATHSLSQTGTFLPGIILTKVVPVPGVHHGYSGYSARRDWMGEGSADQEIVLDEQPKTHLPTASNSATQPRSSSSITAYAPIEEKQLDDKIHN